MPIGPYFRDAVDGLSALGHSSGGSDAGPQPKRSNGAGHFSCATNGRFRPQMTNAADETVYVNGTGAVTAQRLPPWTEPARQVLRHCSKAPFLTRVGDAQRVVQQRSATFVHDTSGRRGCGRARLARVRGGNR